MIPLSSLLSRVRVRYESASGGSTTRFSDSTLMGYANEALECLAESTGFYERYCTIPVEADRIYYDVRGFTPETVVHIKSIWSSGFDDWLKETTPEKFGSTWEQQSGGHPQLWWTRGIYWIGIHPIPNASSGWLRVRFAGIPARFSHTQAVLGDLPDHHYPALEDYMLYEMAGADRQPKRAISHYQDYLKREKALHDQVDRRLVDGRTGVMGRFGGAR